VELLDVLLVFGEGRGDWGGCGGELGLVFLI
jgi:hypothetical protein